MSDEPQVSPLRLAEIKPPRGRTKGSNLALLERGPHQTVVRSFEQQASDLLRQAKERAAQIEREAYECGYAQGEKDGRVMGEKRFEATAQGLRQLLAALSQARQTLLQEAAEELSRLALAMAQAIVRAEVSCGSEVALRTMREALSALSADAPITVRLNPGDLDYLQGRGLLPEGARCEPDPRVAAGGCVAESERERFDARIERQMERLEEALRQEMTRASSGAPPS